jgi:hypothetical protein
VAGAQKAVLTVTATVEKSVMIVAEEENTPVMNVSNEYEIFKKI